MKAITIQDVSLTDLNELQKISKQTFYETFSKFNTKENMSKYLSDELNNEKLKTELSSVDSHFFFAKNQTKCVGYLKLNTGNSQTEFKDKYGLEIERIYILKEYQGKKIGQVLFNKALQMANQYNLKYIWLGVWEENMHAINFYKKIGFIEFDKHIFTVGQDKQIDILMRLELTL